VSELRRGTRSRHERLLALLRAGTTHVDALAAALDVSPSTVRRDLGRLTRQGAVTRTYGGAVTAAAFHERELSERMRLEPAAKAAIGAGAVALLPEAGTVFLDSGSTCARLAEHLPGRDGLTVVTRSPEIALFLAGAAGLEVLLVGGSVTAKSHGLVGPLAALALDRLVVDVAFLGGDAVHPVHGVGEPTLPEAAVKEKVAERARRVVVLADASKLAPHAVPCWAPLPAGWVLVTDEADPEVLDPYRAAGVTVVGVAPERP
jgi:DeoR/GlpR family transcriptional regulator of sugar metabolism